MRDRDNAQGGGSRGVVREIDQQLSRLDKREKQLEAERERLLAARAALTGRAVVTPRARRRVSQDEIASYLTANPGSRPGDIARALQVPATNIATHLHRGKGTRFTRQEDGWHVHSRAGK